MNYRVKFTPQAEADISDAAAYIVENFGVGTVLRFQGSIETLSEMLGIMPYATQIYDAELGIRKFSLAKYPYTLYLRIDNEVMEVIAFTFLHQKRDPETIRRLVTGRLRESGPGV